MNVNNKDLYQILKVDKNANQQQIIKVSQDLIPKNSSGPVEIYQEVDQAIMVLTDPQKRTEYDKSGWKDEWSSEWEKERDFRNQIFEEIQNYKHHYGHTYALKPDGFRVYVYPETHLDPSLLEPCGSWVSKLWEFRGPNWKQELKVWKDKLLSALDQAWEEEVKTPLLGKCWEGVESGNCVKCSKTARLRRKGKTSDSKIYCSPECYYNNWEARVEAPIIKHEFKNFDYKIPELTCEGCHYKGRDVYERGDGEHKCKKCFNKYLEELKNPDYKDKYDDNPAPNPDDKKDHKTPERKPEEPESDPIKRLGKDIESYKSKKKNVPEKDKQEVQDLIDKLERELKTKKLEKFLADKKGGVQSSGVVEYNRFTGKTTEKEVKWNPLLELLNWMKKEGITNISLNSKGNLVVEYGNLTETVEDNKLSKEQKEIKEFFQQNPDIKQSLNQNELEKEVAAMEGTNTKDKDKNGWVLPVVIGMGAVILILIGVIIYKSKKKGY